jgi:hypothetical protein
MKEILLNKHQKVIVDDTDKKHERTGKRLTKPE